MAEMNFVVLSIQASLKQGLIIECSLDIDEDTIDSSSVIVLDKTKSTIELYEHEVDGHLLQIKLKNDPQPGDKYTVLVQNTVKSIVGDPLEEAIFREIVFDSAVTSEVSILSPANFEKVREARFLWKEAGASLVNNFDIQIARENAFYNIVASSSVSGKSEIEFPDIEHGQYYVRCRASLGASYGRWSEIVTFLYDPQKKSSDPPSDDNGKDASSVADKPDDDASFVIDDIAELTLNDFPTNGITPTKCFAFAFNEAISIDSAEINVYRSDF